MNRMYFLFLAIVGLAVILNIFFATSDNEYKEQGAVVSPIYQILITIPIFIVSAIIFFFMRNTELGINYRNLFILLPFILEVLIIAFELNTDILSIFKADSGGYMFRCYVYSIGLATIAMGLFNWILVKIF